MSPLRQQMIDLMTVRNFSPRTHASYLFSMASLVKYFSLPPEKLTQDDIQNYLIYLLKEKGLTPASCRLQLHAIRFFYSHVLHWPELKPWRYSIQTLLKACYSTRLRISELLTLKVADIDSKRMLLRIAGKGAKDRLVPLSPGE